MTVQYCSRYLYNSYIDITWHGTTTQWHVLHTCTCHKYIRLYNNIAIFYREDEERYQAQVQEDRRRIEQDRLRMEDELERVLHKNYPENYQACVHVQCSNAEKSQAPFIDNVYR